LIHLLVWIYQQELKLDVNQGCDMFQLIAHVIVFLHLLLLFLQHLFDMEVDRVQILLCNLYFLLHPLKVLVAEVLAEHNKQLHLEFLYLKT